MNDSKKKIIYTLFALAVFCVAMNVGMGAGTFSNYYSEVFHVTSSQRGFIEIPRETPGILCVFLFTLLSSLGNVKMAGVAELFAFVGIICIALFSPSYGVMLLLIFIQSVGEHLYMPLFESLSLKFAKEGEEGSALGKYKGIQTAGSLVASFLVFVGFKFGFFKYGTGVIPSYVIAAAFCIIAALLFFYLSKNVDDKPENKSRKLILKKEYTSYYLVALAYGCQKRIRIVFAPWVIVNLLSKGTDTMAMLTIITSFIGMLFSILIGKMLDKYGSKTMLRVEAVFMIFVFCFMGVVAAKLVAGQLSSDFIVYVAYVLCVIYEKFAIVHSYFMKELAITKEDITASFSAGLSIDHIMAIIISPIMGVVWDKFGVQYVFYIAAISTVAQFVAAAMSGKRTGVKANAE